MNFHSSGGLLRLPYRPVLKSTIIFSFCITVSIVRALNHSQRIIEERYSVRHARLGDADQSMDKVDRESASLSVRGAQRRLI